MDRTRRVFLVATACLATACTAILGVEDVPNVTVDAAAPPAPTPEGGTPDAATPAADSGTDLAGAIEALSRAYCGQYQKCQPTNFDFNYASADECITAQVAGYTWTAGLPSSGATASAMQACATADAALTCDQWGSAAVLPACEFPGPRQLGDKCLSDVQCASGLCSNVITQCGTCVAPPQAGQPCLNGECAPNLVCSTNGTCATPRGLNAACDDDSPCDYTFVCSGASSSCVTPPAVGGATCGNGIECNAGQGFTCNEQALKCIAYSIVVPGVACTASASVTSTTTAFKACRRATTCNGTCGPFPAEGQACDNASGPYCLAPLFCVNNVCTPLPTSTASCN